ncbi:hypothetical protein STEG23_000106, partial [Scotinomys teguina]
LIFRLLFEILLWLPPQKLTTPAHLPAHRPGRIYLKQVQTEAHVLQMCCRFRSWNEKHHRTNYVYPSPYTVTQSYLGPAHRWLHSFLSEGPCAQNTPVFCCCSQ